MRHVAKNFDHLLGKLPGLSEKQLSTHFELYQGYVKKLNEIEEQLTHADRTKGNYSYSEISELQRRHAVAYNGAYLHQMHFESLTAEEGTKPDSDLRQAIHTSFGSMGHWEQDALSGLKTANGWVLLCRSRLDGELRNVVIEEHHKGLLVEHDALLAIDGWEHAFMIDYGVKEADYFKSLLPSIDWNVVNERFARISAAGERLRAVS